MSKGKPKTAPNARVEWSELKDDKLMHQWFCTKDNGHIKWRSVASIAKNLGRTVDSVISRRNKILYHQVKPDSKTSYALYSPGPSRQEGGLGWRGSKAWSSRDIQALKDLAEAGMSTVYIAGVLARSEKAVEDRIAEMHRKMPNTLWETYSKNPSNDKHKSKKLNSEVPASQLPESPERRLITYPVTVKELKEMLEEANPDAPVLLRLREKELDTGKIASRFFMLHHSIVLGDPVGLFLTRKKD